MNTKKVRVRFAPSPTGALHIGGIRTALFNYLFAKKNKGVFILRIEDTDTTRYIAEAEEYIVKSLHWCGIKIDEGFTVGGDWAPYKQSKRKDIYKKYAEQLINSGHAYYAFDTPSELELLRKEGNNSHSTFVYNFATRKNLKNSLALPEQEVHELINKNTPFVIRFKIPENTDIDFTDIVREKIHFLSDDLDDKVIFKSDGLPTYHLANVVDDYLMQISHVIRGEEWLPSAPLHILLYEALGWERPIFAHLPLILKPSGKGKLSKRDSDQLGVPIFPLEWRDKKTGEVSKGYKEMGYFPEALINILAFLGWNSGSEQEIYSMKELVEVFSLEKIGKTGARFDPEKAKWFNHQYLKNTSNQHLALYLKNVLKTKDLSFDNEYIEKVCDRVKERAYFPEELWQHAYYFFTAPDEYDNKAVKKLWKENTTENMTKLMEVFRTIKHWEADNIEKICKEFIEKNGLSIGKMMNTLRLTIVGKGIGPGLFDIAFLIGKEETLSRIKTAVKHIKIVT